MKLKLWIAGYVVLAVATVVALLYFNNPSVSLLVLAFWIASEALTGWGLSHREKRQANDSQAP
jgi:hypothetical protein